MKFIPIKPLVFLAFLFTTLIHSQQRLPQSTQTECA